MNFQRLNIAPDDNYRVYYRRDGKLYCWLCYGPPERWSFYACTRDGEPSHEVTPPEGMERPDSGQRGEIATALREG